MAQPQGQVVDRNPVKQQVAGVGVAERMGANVPSFG